MKMSKPLKHPYVTYSGDHNLFTSLQSGLTSALPQESVEWRRSFGRPTRCVHVDVDFVPFSEECLTNEPERSILGHPIFHTFWTDCPDIETYKSNVRESLQTWLHQLKQYGRSDWMVILVETPDTKKTNKLLPRTTVLDKLKSDFGGKQTERCVSLIDPTKADSRSIESWQLLLSKMRHLIMVAYNRALNKFEEAMRSERERRTERNWSFCKYFLLQEELAQVFKMLSLYDESLVQYDELDALFTQFILNSAAGDTPTWLSNFNHPCDTWEGLCLNKSCDVKLQEKIRNKTINLLEFRNYLFQCQALLLIQQNKPWELASRSLTFLQNTVSELRILDVSIANGGVACWGFLSCLEIIQLLTKYKDPSTTDSHALHTAPLWSYARDKLKELGTLCGLTPGSKTSSEQLHIVISLVCGMGEDPHANDNHEKSNENTQLSPMSRIKEALSSQESFKKHFLDLSEVAISTYKHIGRIRSARLIGRDLALFYLKEGSLHQAANFLSDQLKTFVEERWHLLTAHTQTELSKCYLATNDKERYIKTCVQLAACPVDSYMEIRVEMLNKMLESAKNIEEDKTYSISTDRILEMGWLKVSSTNPIILGSDVVVQLEVFSNLPVSIKFDKVQMQLKQNEEKPKKAEKPSLSAHKSKTSDIERKGSSASVVSSHSSNRKHSNLSVRSSSELGEASHQKHSKVSSPLKQEREEEEEDCAPRNPYLKRLQMSFHHDFKQDKSLSSVSVNCLNPHKVLRREDSLGGLDNIEKGIVKEDFSYSLATESVDVNPGKNVIELKTQVTKKGFLVGGQIMLIKDRLEFICNKNSIRGKPLVIEVISENPQIFLGRKERELLAGIPQLLIFTVNSGSSNIAKDSKVKLKCSRGLTLKLDDDTSRSEKEPDESAVISDFERDVEISLPEIKPFNQSVLQLQALTELIPQKDASTIEHNVCITSDLLEEARLDVDIHFIPPFVASHKLHTANLRKYIQIIISGIVKQQMKLSNPCISFLDEQKKVPLTLLNSKDEKLIVCADLTASYMWEMTVDYSVLDPPHLKMEFSLDYRPLMENEDSTSSYGEQRSYKYNFELHNYKTLYTVKARVEPTKGSEFCRAGNMCHFHIVIQQVDADCPDSLFKKKESSSSESSGPSSLAANSIMYEVITDQAMWAVCGRTSGVLTLDTETRQTVMLDVMPLIGGFLPLPSVRLSKYIPAESKQMLRDGKRSDIVGTASSVPRLEPFSPGQVYNFSKALQVHVLPVANVQSESSVN